MSPDDKEQEARVPAEQGRNADSADAFTGGDLLAFADYLLAGQTEGEEEREVYETWVSFRLGGEVFALPVGCVQEVTPLGEITRVADAPSPVRGVTSLRGQVLPLVDLRASLGMGDQVISRSTQMMVAESEGRRIGVLVDRVQKVLRLAMSKVEELAPGSSLGVVSRWLKGFYPDDQGPILLLDAEPLLRFEPQSQEGVDT